MQYNASLTGGVDLLTPKPPNRYSDPVHPPHLRTVDLQRVPLQTLAGISFPPDATPMGRTPKHATASPKAFKTVLQKAFLVPQNN